MMRLAKPFFLAVLGFALVAYGFDCGATTTPAEAMQCCGSMPCSHGMDQDEQDCCATTPAMHAPFVQSSAGHGISSASVVFAALPAPGESLLENSSTNVVAAPSHGPPISPSTD